MIWYYRFINFPNNFSDAPFRHKQKIKDILNIYKKMIIMDIQSRKIHFIQEFLKYANTSILDQFEEMLKIEREKVFEKEIEPMTLKEYELRVEKAFEDVKNNRVKSQKVKAGNRNMEIVVVWSDTAKLFTGLMKI
ncbi:MAG: hypothetical protein C0397_18505 [Odoribacter sp.]|nr:hypothetical protein [Odoribacter sp.]